MSICVKPFDVNNVDNKPLAIYGANACAEMSINAIRHLDKFDISIVIDKMYRKKEFCGVKVVSIGNVENISDYNILICASGNFWNIANNLYDMGVKTVYQALPLFDVIKVRDESIFDTKGKYQNAVLQNKELAIYNLSIVITEKCSLKCKYCTEFMPYIKNAVSEFSVEKCKKNVDKILEVVNGLESITILGGEAFVNPKWEQILELFLNDNRIKKVSILTNGTVIPKSYEIMQNNKFTLEIDDYGKRGKTEKVREWAESHNIKNIVYKHEHWFDVSDCSYIDESEQDICDKFQLCQIKGCWSIVDKYLFRCPTAYYRLKYMLGKNIDEYNDFINLELMSSNEIENKIRELIDIPYIEACHFCKGTNENNMIDVAEQI